jgi:hypothetical protein
VKALKDVGSRDSRGESHRPSVDDYVNRTRESCNPGHDDGTIPPSEVSAHALSAIIYREYLTRPTVPKCDLSHTWKFSPPI